MKACIGLALFVACSVAFAENIVFPPNTPGVHDITKAPYYADNTGQDDVTDILNRALEETRTQGNWAPHILYLPNGTYLTTGEVTWKLPLYTIGPHMVGQSREGTVIRLKDSTWVGATQIGYVLKTGGDVAQNFCRGLSNLTVHTGVGNAGAIGVKWYANNEALMSDINIIDGDGKAAAGLQVGSVEEGPALARRIYINGFRFGVLARPSLNTITLSEIFVENQTMYGVYHTGDLPLYLDSLYSNNTVPAVYNGATAAQLILLNADLRGGDPAQPAIINEPGAMIFARNISTQGYSRAIQANDAPVTAPSGTEVGEYLTHPGTSLFGDAGPSLNLPMKRPPEVQWEQDVNKIANIEDYTSGRNDTQALQAAIDDASKTTVILPLGRNYSLSGEVYVRGNIRRIIGAGAELHGGSLVITDGTPSTVIIQKVAGSNGFGVIQRSSRTVVLESATHYGRVRHEGSGDMFLVDVVTQATVNHADASLWAWHYNAEGGDNMLEVLAGNAWIFGWKDEGVGTSAYLRGGQTEIFGLYQMHGDDVAQVVIENDAKAAIVNARKGRYGSGYEIIVRETRNGETRELLASENTSGFPTSFDVTLFTAYGPDYVIDTRPSVASSGRSRGLRARISSDRTLLVGGTPKQSGEVSVRLYDGAGRVMQSFSVRAEKAVPLHEEIALSFLPRGVYWVELQSVGESRVEQVMLVR